ncbi:MAG: hypothetical protein V3W18_13955 [candidate division Zixibacteria bacterium]
MIRKILVVLLCLVMAVSIAHAKKEKTTTIKDNIAVDKKYGWELPVPKNWKAKSQKEPNVERLFMEKKNFMVNPFIQTYGGDYTIPRVLIFVQEFNGTVDDFQNLIMKSLEEHKTDNEIIKKLGLLQEGEYIISSDVLLESRPIKQIYLKRTYSRMLYITEGGGAMGGREEYINDNEVHEIYLIKLDNLIMVFQAYCEREFYEANSQEFESLIRSLKFPEN